MRSKLYIYGPGLYGKAWTKREPRIISAANMRPIVGQVNFEGRTVPNIYRCAGILANML